MIFASAGFELLLNLYFINLSSAVSISFWFNGPHGRLLTVNLLTDLGAHHSELSFLGKNLSNGAVDGKTSSRASLTAAEYVISSQVSKGELSKCILWLGLQSFLWVFGVNPVKWNGEKSDGDAQVHQTEHDVEVGVDTISENEEWVLNDLTFRLWHLDLHFFEKSLSQGMLEIWLLLLALSKAAE